MTEPKVGSSHKSVRDSESSEFAESQHDSWSLLASPLEIEAPRLSASHMDAGSCGFDLHSKDSKKVRAQGFSASRHTDKQSASTLAKSDLFESRRKRRRETKGRSEHTGPRWNAAEGYTTDDEMLPDQGSIQTLYDIATQSAGREKASSLVFIVTEDKNVLSPEVLLLCKSSHNRARTIQPGERLPILELCLNRNPDNKVAESPPELSKLYKRYEAELNHSERKLARCHPDSDPVANKQACMDNVYECQLCTKVFTSGRGLGGHMSKKHSGQARSNSKKKRKYTPVSVPTPSVHLTMPATTPASEDKLFFPETSPPPLASDSPI